MDITPKIIWEEGANISQSVWSKYPDYHYLLITPFGFAAKATMAEVLAMVPELTSSNRNNPYGVWVVPTKVGVSYFIQAFAPLVRGSALVLEDETKVEGK